MLAQSEAAYVALLATFVLIGLLSKRVRLPTIVLIGVATITVFLSPLRQTVFTKLTLHDTSGEVRRSQWTETIELLKDHPLTGVGLSGYPIALEPHHTYTQYEIFQYPHNIFLNIWTELGLLGLLAFAILSFTILRTQVPTLHSPFSSSLISTPAFFALLEMTVHGLVDVPYFKNDLAVLTWLLLALLVVQTQVSASAKPTR
jgi:O-antigen ligase